MNRQSPRTSIRSLVPEEPRDRIWKMQGGLWTGHDTIIHCMASDDMGANHRVDAGHGSADAVEPPESNNSETDGGWNAWLANRLKVTEGKSQVKTHEGRDIASQGDVEQPSDEIEDAEAGRHHTDENDVNASAAEGGGVPETQAAPIHVRKVVSSEEEISSSDNPERRTPRAVWRPTMRDSTSVSRRIGAIPGRPGEDAGSHVALWARTHLEGAGRTPTATPQKRLTKPDKAASVEKTISAAGIQKQRALLSGATEAKRSQDKPAVASMRRRDEHSIAVEEMPEQQHPLQNSGDGVPEDKAFVEIKAAQVQPREPEELQLDEQARMTMLSRIEVEKRVETQMRPRIGPQEVPRQEGVVGSVEAWP